MEWKKRDTLLVYSVGAGLLAITAAVYWLYFQPDWKYYQSDFRDLVTQRFGAARAQAAVSGIQQIWIPALDRVDRCTTC